MTILIICCVLIILLIYFWSYFIYAIFHFKTFITYTYKDIYSYFKFKKYNQYINYGVITMYTASGTQVFGSGKTLSMVRHVISIYKQYNDKIVYDKDNKKFVTQKIHVISNVDLKTIPYIKFNNVNQFIDIDKYNFGNMDIILYVLDESGAIFNSREFRSNISTEMLTRLLQSRKNKCCLFTTSQRFNFTDKILRQICCVVYECSKQWRFVSLRAFNPLDLEFAYNPEIIKPKKKLLFFCTDEIYNSYDSYQLIEDLNKKYKPISDAEILSSYGQDNVSVENINPHRLKRTYFKNKGVKK